MPTAIHRDAAFQLRETIAGVIDAVQSRGMTSHIVNPPDLAVVTFDLSRSGVNRNALRIATAAHAAGLVTEIWTAQNFGELRSEVPSGVPLLSLGAEIGGGYTRSLRREAIATATRTLSEMITARQSRVILSAGNHIHLFAVNAFATSPRPDGMRLVGRVSNALRPFERSLWKLRGNLKKRLHARKRYKSMHRLIAVTEEIRRDLVQKMGVDDRRIVVIPNGIDLTHARELGSEAIAHPWLGAGGQPVVLGVGRLVPQKNFELLLRAFAIARSSLSIRLLILGDGPAEYRAHLATTARELGISGDVCFVGAVQNPFPYYRSAHLFVLSSAWEGMSNVLLEALASGCPVVATACLGGSAEMLADGEYGAVVPMNDPALLAAAIVKRLREARNSEILRKRASDFDLQTSMNRYVSVLQEELAAQP